MTQRPGGRLVPLATGPIEVVADRFEIECEAGVGAMSVVYRARDRKSGELVALKVLRARVETDTERFAREARLLSVLEHPGIVRYIDHGTTAEGEPYIAMEWLEGETLARRLTRLGLTILESIELGRGVADALAAVHDRGIVHRDLEPSSLFLPLGGGVKVLDFGIATSALARSGLTAAGHIVGTPGYMAPEQARGSSRVDGRADIFSLGCVLFECLTGRAAFEGGDLLSVLSKLATEEPPPLRTLCAQAPEPLAALVAGMMTKRVEGRPQRAADVAAELARLADEVRSVAASQRRAPATLPASRFALLRDGAPAEAHAGAGVADEPASSRDGPSVSAGSSAAPASIRTLGRYALHQEIASGGMGTVHIGRLLGPVGFSRTVAIKRLHPQFAKDPEFVSMFLDEARLAARIRHPNAVSTLDVVALKGEIVLVMDYIQGESLGRLLKCSHERGARIPLAVVSGIVCGVLAGLHAAHEARSDQGEPLGIVHRDVSPQNVLVGVDGIARVVDFGIAKAAGRLQVSRDGQIKGKLAYMPVEQVRGEVLDRRADVYSAAVVLWEALTLRRMFPGEQAAIVYELLEGWSTPPSHVAEGIPPELDALVMRGLSRDREHRFETAIAMADALERIVPPATPRVIAAWVEATAARELQDRAALIAEVERNTPPSSSRSSILAQAAMQRAEVTKPAPPPPQVKPRHDDAPALVAAEDSRSKDEDLALLTTVDIGSTTPGSSLDVLAHASEHPGSMSPETLASRWRRAARAPGRYYLISGAVGAVVAGLWVGGRGAAPRDSSEQTVVAPPTAAPTAAPTPSEVLAAASAAPSSQAGSTAAPSSSLAPPKTTSGARAMPSGRAKSPVKPSPSAAPSAEPLPIESKYGI